MQARRPLREARGIGPIFPNARCGREQGMPPETLRAQSRATVGGTGTRCQIKTKANRPSLIDVSLYVMDVSFI